MATLKVKCRPSRDGKRGTIYYQIIKHRITRRISSGITIPLDYWDFQHQCIVPVSDAIICNAIKRMQTDIDSFRRIIATFEASDMPYTPRDVIAAFCAADSQVSFFDFFDKVIVTIDPQKRTHENYLSARASFLRYTRTSDITLADISPEIIDGYQQWLMAKGNSINTVSFYMRILRAVYNRAVKASLVTDIQPFADVYTGHERTAKRAISHADMKAISRLDLSHSKRLQRARDMFILSYYLRGISAIDLFLLEKTSLRGNLITYLRRKTGQRLTIRLEPRVLRLIGKYKAPHNSPYLLDVIRNPCTDVLRQYKNALRETNASLKQVARLAGIGRLTTYVSRHTWATVAKKRGIPISVISDALGHTDSKTTLIYLDSCDPSRIDEANRIVCAGI